MNIPHSPYRGYRFPPEIISYCVWLYFRFSVGYRDIEELMAERGVTVTLCNHIETRRLPLGFLRSCREA